MKGKESYEYWNNHLSTTCSGFWNDLDDFCAIKRKRRNAH